MAQEEELEELYGKIISVVYTNEENGWTVLRLETQDAETVTVVGTLPSAYAGEELHVMGFWTVHPNHGRQFKCEYAERSLPRTKEAIYAYLAGRAVKGVGPATAALIVDKFGDKTLDVLEGAPEKLCGIRGISPAKAEAISREFRRQAGLRRLMEFLCAHELRPLLAVRLYRFYGEDAMEAVTENPYICAAPHIGASFAEADRLAFDLSYVLKGDSYYIAPLYDNSDVCATTPIEKVNINTGSAEDLKEIAGFNKTVAAAIVEYRQSNPFKAIEELLDVSGIGPATFTATKNKVTIKSA